MQHPKRSQRFQGLATCAIKRDTYYGEQKANMVISSKVGREQADSHRGHIDLGNWQIAGFGVRNDSPNSAVNRAVGGD